ncbi:MAG TPA: hypothetical protein VGY54_00655 [Polyangiaceae bacterium]|nr:hypothetical protein [Polyangiaceae bacterium]
MIYRLSVVSLGFLFAGFLGCGRSPLFDAFATDAGTMPITTGAGGGSESTGVGGTGPMTGAATGEAGSSTGQPGNSAGQAGSSAGGLAGSGAGEAGSGAGGHAGSSGDEGGSGVGGHAGSVGQGGSSGSGGASGAGGSQGGSGGSISVGNACNPVAQNCGPGLRCDLPDSGPLMFQCIMDGGATGSEGQICRELSQDCAKGSTCIQIVNRSGRSIGSPHCFVFCNADADCPKGDRCDDALLMPDGGGNSGENVRTGICR